LITSNSTMLSPTCGGRSFFFVATGLSMGALFLVQGAALSRNLRLDAP